MNNVAYLPAAKQEEMARPFDAVEFAMMEQFVISFTARDGDNSVQVPWSRHTGPVYHDDSSSIGSVWAVVI